MNNQDSLTDTVATNFKKEQDKKGPDLRHLHPKSHGLLHDKFIVNDDPR